MTVLIPGTRLEVAPGRAQRPELQALLEHWQSKRRGRTMPARGDLVLSEIKPHLGWMSLIDVLPGATDFRYRLVGTRINFHFSADATGHSVSETFATWPEAREIILALLRQVVEQKTPLRTFGDLAWMGRALEDFESLFLPLSEDGETVNCIMNPFVFDHSRMQLNRSIRAQA